MRGSRGPLLVLGATGLLLAGGCQSLSCINPETYSNAREIDRLKMPAGLDGPDTDEALQIPALNEPELPRDPEASCLEDPPISESLMAPADSSSDLPGPAQAPSEEPRRRARPGPR